MCTSGGRCRDLQRLRLRQIHIVLDGPEASLSTQRRPKAAARVVSVYPPPFHSNGHLCRPDLSSPSLQKADPDDRPFRNATTSKVIMWLRNNKVGKKD
jgi:hypothetical protein